jgi:predicted cupin superfamily sugar epimerase
MPVMERPELAELLELEAHPEGGWYRETWRSEVEFTPEGYGGERASATAIYFLLAPGEESRWHRVRSAEVWLWHSGGPLTLEYGATPETAVAVTLGPDVKAGERPQVVVPAGAWQAARPAGDQPVLVSCIVSPGFDFADFTA